MPDDLPEMALNPDENPGSAHEPQQPRVGGEPALVCLVSEALIQLKL